MILNGQGPMELDFDGSDPWYGLWLHNCEAVTGVIVKRGIRSLQPLLLCGHMNLKRIALPSDFKLPRPPIDFNDYFEGTQLQTVYGVPGSDAERFANALGVDFSDITKGVSV